MRTTRVGISSFRRRRGPPACVRPLPVLGLGVAIAWLGAAPPVLGQFIPPEPGKHVLVSEIRGAESVFSNPAALAFDHTTEALGVLALGPEPGDSGLRLRQMLLAGRAGALAVALRRDSFRPAAGESRLDGSSFTIAVGVGNERFAVGAMNDQYRRGLSSSRWELGGMWKATPWLTLGTAWRNIGSPIVIGERAPAHVAAGVTAVVPSGWGSLSIEGTMREGSLDGVRTLARLRLPRGIDALTSLAVDGNGDLDRFTFGLGYRFNAVRGFGVLGRDVNRPGGDASEYTLGASAWF